MTHADVTSSMTGVFDDYYLTKNEIDTMVKIINLGTPSAIMTRDIETTLLSRCYDEWSLTT